MILRFAALNFRSFRGRGEISYISTSRKDSPDWRFQSQHAPHGVLPLVGVWGANASGKTNLLAALLETRRLVRSSFTDLEPDQKVPWVPWRMTYDPQHPAGAELDIALTDDTRVHFGFRVDEGGIQEEWLYRYQGRRRQVLYHRQRAEEQPWYFGPALKGQRHQIAEATRDNCLFLSTAAQHNNATLLPIFRAIVDGIRPERRIELRGSPLFAKDEALLSEDFRPTLLRLLAAADLGISDVRVEEFEVNAPRDAPGIEEIFRPEFLAELRRTVPEKKLTRLCFLRGASDQGAWELPPEMESRGTNVLMARLADIMRVLKAGQLLVLDEIDTSLHPDLCAEIVGLFTDPRSNPHGAQLLFSTHDRSLLRALRTDEVMLLDRDRDGESHARPASDYKGLRTRDDLRAAHEQGRIRGVPVMGDMCGALESDSSIGS
ncbi:MAG: ATP-binding protein [Deltaproteobacteria bacterium]|nr:ATP-binding protein [Deltaproteobacteria bacterium]